MGRYREIMDDWFDRVWGHNDLDHIDKLTNIDVTTNGHLGRTLKGAEDFKGFHGLITNILDDISIKILHSVEDKEWASLLYQLSGRKKDTHEAVEVTGISMIRFQNDAIIEVYEQFDFMTFFEMLGKLPEQSLEKLLTDKSLSYR